MNSRRAFLTAASGAAVLGASERVRIGVIGTGGRGQYLMKELIRTGQAEVVAVCDIYSRRRDEAASLAGGAVKTYLDHRRVLDHNDIDAVVIATPDHWHAAIAVDACKAGKDIYVEKPMVHQPKDGQDVVRAVRAHARILQVGTQARAVTHFQEARRRYVESGAIGPVGLVRTWYNANGGYLLKAPPGMERQPEGMDWKRWLGPGPKVPWNPEIFFSPYKWLHYDGGMIMGIGIHVIDSAHQFCGLTKPAAAVAGGGIYRYADGRDTPDVVNLILEYPQKLNVTFEAELFTAGIKGSDAGIEVHGAGGMLTVLRYDKALGYQFRPDRKNAAAAAVAPGGPCTAEGLVKDWLECIRSRRKPVSDVESGYYSAMACFMGSQAYRTRTRVVWEEKWNI